MGTLWKFRRDLSSVLLGWIYCLLLSLFILEQSRAETFDDSEIKHIAYPDWFVDSPFLDFTELLTEAHSDGKRGLMILFTTEGCSYCDRFIRTSLGNTDIANQVQANFSSVGLEIFNDAEMISPEGASFSVKQFAEQQGVQFSPSLLFFDGNGNRLLRLIGYQSPERFSHAIEYLSGGHDSRVSFAKYMEQQSAPQPKVVETKLIDDPLFIQPPYALDRSRFPASQPLLVLFESGNCEECQSFHADVLGQPDVRNTLGQFEVVRLDASDTKTPVIAPDGSKTTPASWYEQEHFSRMPALLFYDEEGNKALQSDALILRQRMMNSLNLVLEGAHKKGWTYQRFARSKGLERLNAAQD